MGIFQFSYNSIGYISGTVFSLFLLVALAVIRRKTRQTWILILYLLCTLFLNFGFLIRTSVFSPLLSKPACFLIALYTCFSNSVLLSFLYSFYEKNRRREPKIALSIFVLTGVFGFLYYVIRNLDSKVFYNFNIQMFEFQRPETTAPMGVLHFLTFFWILFVIARRYSEEKREIFRGRRVVHPGIKEKNLKMWSSFGWAVSIHALFSLSYVLYGLGFLSFSNFQLVLTSATSIQLFLYTIIYLNYSPQPSSFMVKIVGVSLATVLILLGITARITFQIIESYYDGIREAEIENIRENLRFAGKYSLPDNVAYLTSHPRQPGSFDSELIVHSEIDPRILSHLLEKNEVEETQRFFQSSKEDSRFGIRLTDDMFRREYYGIRKGNTGDFISKRMYRELNYPGNVSVYIIRYIFASDDRIYEIGYPYESYSRSVHSIVVTMASILILAAVLLLLLLPYLFREGLARPLKSLVEELEHVNAGDYKTMVPVKSEDEFGSLARSFNRIVASIQAVRDELKHYTDATVKKTSEDRKS